MSKRSQSESLMDPVITEKEEEGEKFLSPEDLFQVELSQMRLQLSGTLLREKRLEDRADDLSVRNILLELQVKAHEHTIIRINRKKELDASIKTLDDRFIAAGKSHEVLKKTISEKYVIDMNKVTYDDVTGKLTLVPEPQKEK